MQITCRSCETAVPADDVNLETVLAKCRHCHAVFDFSAQVRGSAPASEVKKKRDLGELPMPKGLVVDDGGSVLTITRKWGRGPAIFFLIFSGFWNMIVGVFVVAGIAGAFNEPKAGEMGGWFIWVFLTPFIAVGLGTGYAALALLLNRTTIRVDGSTLTVDHAPFRWPGRRSIDTYSLDQLYCQEYVAYKQNNVPQYRLAIHALQKDGTRVKLLGGIENAGQAIYLERLLEKHLGIEDRPVRDEYQG